MPNIPEEILIKSLTKTATTDELQILKEWLQEDKKNRELYFQLEEIWAARQQVPLDYIHSSWDKLSKEIKHRPQGKSRYLIPKKKKNHSWLWYAAAVFIGVVIASAFRKNFPAPEQIRESVIVQNIVYNQSGVQPILLPDSSEIWIHGKSKVTYPEKFTKDKRLVELEGKAYFDIQKDTLKPFVVRIGKVEIEVTGTEFFVETALNESSLVTLITGSVNLNYDNQAGEKTSLALKPGQQASIDEINSQVNIFPIDTSYYIAWKDGTYRFNDESLERIAATLGKKFDLDIRITESLKKKRFTGRVIPDNKIEDVLITLSKSYPLKYKITGKRVIISE